MRSIVQVIMRGCFLFFSVGTTLGCGLCMQKYVLLARACQKAPGMHLRCLQTSLNRKGSTKILL